MNRVEFEKKLGELKSTRDYYEREAQNEAQLTELLLIALKTLWTTGEQRRALDATRVFVRHEDRAESYRKTSDEYTDKMFALRASFEDERSEALAASVADEDDPFYNE